jgi:hypothetical protein
LADVICKNHQSRRGDLEPDDRLLGQIDTRAKARRVAVLLRQESDNLRAEIEELQTRQRPLDAGSVIQSWRSSERRRLIDSWAKATTISTWLRFKGCKIRIGLATAKAEAGQAYGFEVCGQD